MGHLGPCRDNGLHCRHCHRPLRSYPAAQVREKLKKLGEPTVPTLEDGLWRCGGGGSSTSLPGTLGSHGCWSGRLSTPVPWLCHRARGARAEAYKLYQKRTSVWIPWFRKAGPEPKHKDN
ncbi:hypothetical protein E2562_023504 [Oryza meyeriana var. granulata]|uniref:Uncharacterized protein n=1 Tax=Oryza meyeriana var. granulata TaxID=110450 RepID=A0A6G1BZC1_9ORYZ|nr:hypothetical protein E2562_023504 [Oryza meyeriana var. granulata]